MPYTQKEQNMGKLVVSVQTDEDHSFAVVPETPNLLKVDMPFLQYHCQGLGDPRIDNPKDDVVYLVTMQNNKLVIEEVQIGA